METAPARRRTVKKSSTPATAQTKRNHAKNRQELWSIFDKEMSSPEPATPTPDEEELDKKMAGLCSKCNTILVISEEGFPVCPAPDCGLMFCDVVDSSPEWKFFNGGDDKGGNDNTRCGNPINPLLAESSMGCKITCGTGSSYKLRKIRRYTEWQSMPHREKSLYNEFQYITIMASNAGIPRIFIDEAMIYHKEISGQLMLRGINRDGIKAASIYIACRILGHPRTAKEIADIFNIDKTSASNGCSMAVNLLQQVKRNGGGGFAGATEDEIPDLCVSLPSSFIFRFCSNLQMDDMPAKLCHMIAKRIEHESLLADDNMPHSIAAGIIYYVVRIMDLNITKTDIRAVCNVSEVTINKCSKKIEAIKEKVLPSVFLARAAAARP